MKSSWYAEYMLFYPHVHLVAVSEKRKVGYTALHYVIVGFLEERGARLVAG